MKKIYLFTLLTCFLAGFIPQAKATTHLVTVQDFMFSPATFVASTGDTIHWMWLDGSHTTTSTSIPAGAASWNSGINAASPDFFYEVTVAGSYDYVCTPHASMGMVASFTVVEATSLAELSAPSLMLLKSYVQDGNLFMEYESAPGQVSIQLFDITGQRVYAEKPGDLSSGIHNFSIPVRDLPPGVYILNISDNTNQRTRRIILE